jgi:hypothetical protein
MVRIPGYKSRSPGSITLQNQIFWEVVGLEQSSFGLVSTTEELLVRKSGGSGVKNREYSRRDPLCFPSNTPYLQTLALTSPASGGSSVDSLAD